LFQSLSALLAFFDDTALGVPSVEGAILKLAIPMGTAVLFRFDFLHHGWKCADEKNPENLLVHFRAHFYLFSGRLLELPTFNFEATLEYLSIVCSNTLDSASKLLLLECLQTFVPYVNYQESKTDLKPFKEIAQSRGYSLFANQQVLDLHCANQE